MLENMDIQEMLESVVDEDYREDDIFSCEVLDCDNSYGEHR